VGDADGSRQSVDDEPSGWLTPTTQSISPADLLVRFTAHSFQRTCGGPMRHAITKSPSLKCHC
jgi:hypothetical protein